MITTRVPGRREARSPDSAVATLRPVRRSRKSHLSGSGQNAIGAKPPKRFPLLHGVSAPSGDRPGAGGRRESVGTGNVVRPVGRGSNACSASNGEHGVRTIRGSGHKAQKDKKMVALDPRLVRRGAKAERRFADWLDASVLPHLYVEQSPMTVPAPLRGEIKRPDYLVGIPGVGMVAFDVKSKTIYEREGIIFDLAEVQKLRAFSRLFHVTVYFACLDPEGGPDAYWVCLDQLDAVPAVRRGKSFTLACPTDRTLSISLDEDFYAAFVRAVALV